MRAVVIGGGLFGQIITRGLKEKGYAVYLLDNRQPAAGSPPAACLIREEWCGKLGDDVYQTGMKWLEERYPVYHKELVQFPNRALQVPGKRITCTWYDPKNLMPYDSHHFAVHQLVQGGNLPWGAEGRWIGDDVLTNDIIGADLVVVAAGVWSQALVPWVDLGLVGKAGMAYLYPKVHQPGFIVPWAPYKQIVGFHRGDGFWVSDGSAIKPENFDEERRQRTFERCGLTPKESGGKALEFKELFGIRPYTKQLPCFCREVAPKLWVAVGARKNGTLLGAWCAKKIQESL
jgi:glycine/D-amino acid oxidase-like deaminating enzyme